MRWRWFSLAFGLGNFTIQPSGTDSARGTLILLPTAMKTPLFYALLLAASAVTSASAWPGGGTLNLVSDASYNKLQVTVGIPSVLASNTQTTTVTGTIDILADVDPATGATTALTLTGGKVAMSNMHFVLYAYIFFKAADITTAGMAGTVYTPPPLPAPATPTATGGTFDAALHHLVINSGTLSGTAGYPTASPVNVNFADSPIDGAGTGTGTVTVVPGASSATHRTCQTTIVLPVDFTDTQDLNGTAVSVRVKGNVKAVGNILIPLNSAVAAPSTWINPAGGTWATPANWLAAVIGNGTYVDFSTLNLTSDATVTLDGPRTVRGLHFGDPTPSHNWTLTPGTGGSLTLDAGATQPVIAVTNSTATLGVVLDGTQGFAKTGQGTLILTQANTYTGNTLVNGGTLALASGGTLSFKIGATGVNNQVTGTGTANLDGKFKLDLSTANTTTGNAWTLVNVAMLTETFGAAFAVDGFAENAHVWTTIRNGKKWTFTEADGKLSVVGTYGSWATDHGTAGEPAIVDHDRDGLNNGLEYALGLDPIIANGTPGTVTAGVISFTKGTAAIANGDVTYVIETSDNLGTWTPRVTHVQRQL